MKKILYFGLIILLFLSMITITHAIATNTTTYTLTFIEHGLPHNASWNITIGNTTYKSWSNKIIYKGYGNTTYKINAPKYFSSNITTGTVNLLKNITINITFSIKYTGLLFVEYNLPMNTSWSVVLGNHSLNSTSTYIYFVNFTGGFNYVASSNEYKTISGYIFYKNFTELYLNFSKAIYELIFVPSGLSEYQQISVTINNITKTGPYVIFYLPNGTYNYSVQQVYGYNTDMGMGKVVVSGTTVEIIQFKLNKILYQQNENEIAALTIIAVGILAFIIYLAKGRRRVR
jgi:hypothetical protein